MGCVPLTLVYVPSLATDAAAGRWTAVSNTRDPTPRVLYRCCGCGFEFAPALPRAAPCPRCGSIGGHEEIGRAGGGRRGD